MDSDHRETENPGTAYLGLGSNLGDRERSLRTAIAELRKISRIISVSSIYETDPWGTTPGGKYLNLVAGIDTGLPPAELMTEIIRIEEGMGRKRTRKWEPRIIDIDILFYDDIIIKNKDITIPHPLIAERRFVLIPLVEIAGYFTHPVYDTTVKVLLEKCEDGGTVIEWKNYSDL